MSATQNTLKALSPKQRDELLAALKARFDANKARHSGSLWAMAQARLADRPEKLWSLAVPVRLSLETLVGQRLGDAPCPA